MDLENLVQVITREVLKQLNGVELDCVNQEKPQPKILALYTGGSIGFSQSVQQMETVAKWAQINGVLSKSAAKIYSDQNTISSLPFRSLIKEGEDVSVSRLLEGVKLVLIPILTFNSMSKLAVGICDTLILNIVVHCLITGIPVVAAKNAADLLDQERKSLSTYRCNTALTQMSHGGLRKLEDLGIQLVDINQMAERARAVVFPQTGVKEVNKGKKQVITQEDITSEVISRGSLTIPANALLTSLAQDLIQTHGLVIHRE